MVFFSSKISPFTSTVIFLDRSPMATAVETSAMLRTWPVRLAAIMLTLSVRSFQVPPTPRTCAWPPSLPSVPTSRATRVTSELKARSWSTIVLTIRAVSRNCPCNRRPSMSIGIVCERSPLATALMTRAISVLGRTTSSIRSLIESNVAAHAPPASPIDACLTWPSLPTRLLKRRSSRSRRWLDSMMSLIAVATLPACPVDVTGMRTVKSPRLTAVRTRSITLGSVFSVARALLAILSSSSPFPFLALGVVPVSGGGHPEFDLGSRSGLADNAAPAARELGAFSHREKPQMAGDVKALVDHEAGAVIGHLDDEPAVKRRGCHPNARRMGVFFHVGQGLGHVLEDDRVQLIWKVTRKGEIDVGFDPGVDAHAVDAVADGLLEADGEVKGGRAHPGEQPAKGVLDLLDRPRQLIELPFLAALGDLVADPFQLQLGSCQQLQ